MLKNIIDTEDFRFAFQSVKGVTKKIFDYDMKPSVVISDNAVIYNAPRNVFGENILIRMCTNNAMESWKLLMKREKALNRYSIIQFLDLLIKRHAEYSREYSIKHSFNSISRVSD